MPCRFPEKCSREKQDFWKNQFLKKKLRTSSGKLSADLRTAFFVSTGKYWGKICSPQSFLRIIPTLDSEQKTLGRFFKPVLELYRATFRTKYCFLEETLFYLQLRIRVKKICWVVKLASLLSRGTSRSETSFWNRKQFSLFFLLCTKVFRQNWEPHSSCPSEHFEVLCNFWKIQKFIFFLHFEWKAISVIVKEVFYVSRVTFRVETYFWKSYTFWRFQEIKLLFLGPLTTSLGKVVKSAV